MYLKLFLVSALIITLTSAEFVAPANYKEAKEEKDIQSQLVDAKTKLVVLIFICTPLTILKENLQNLMEKYKNVEFISVDINSISDKYLQSLKIYTSGEIEFNNTFVILMPQLCGTHVKKWTKTFRMINNFDFLEKEIQGFTNQIQESSGDDDLEAKLIVAGEKIVLVVFQQRFTIESQQIGQDLPELVIITANPNVCTAQASKYGVSNDRDITSFVFIKKSEKYLELFDKYDKEKFSDKVNEIG